MSDRTTHLNGTATRQQPQASGAALAIAQKLKSRYFYCVDNKLWAQLRALFTDDARLEGFPFQREGADAFVQGCADFHVGATSVHQGFMPSIWEKSPSLIRARWSMHDYMTWADGEEESGNWTGFHGYGYYEEEYELTSEGWRISFMRLSRIRIDLASGQRTFDMGGPVGPGGRALAVPLQPRPATGPHCAEAVHAGHSPGYMPR